MPAPESAPQTVSVAYKEWAVIVAALVSGKQSVLIRKGGIHEGRAGFQVAHRDFVVFPTYFHLDEQPPLPLMTADLLPQVIAERPTADRILLQTVCRVESVEHLTDEAQLSRFEDLHGWSPETIAQRFHYRTPGVFVLLVRVFQLPEPLELSVTPEMQGCKTWVELPQPLHTQSARPVLTDAEWEQIARRVRPL